MSKGGSSKSGAAIKAFKPYALNAANNVQSVVGNAAPGLQSLTDQVQGLVPGLIDKYNAGDPALNASENYTTSTLGRDPWAGSSQLDNLIHTTNNDVRDQVGASFGSRGSFGGTAWETALAKGLAGNEAGLRYGDVQNQQQLQAQAAGLAPQQAAAQYLGITPLLAAAQTGAALPYTGINAQSNDLGSLFSGANVQKQGSNVLGSILQGVGAAGSAIAMSDRRLKTDVEKLGEFHDGLGHYRFRYLWSPEIHEGVMADEVEKLRPWALGPFVSGYATVDYSKLGAAQ